MEGVHPRQEAPPPPQLPTPSISLLWVMDSSLQDLLECFSVLVIMIVRTGAQRDPCLPSQLLLSLQLTVFSVVGVHIVRVEHGITTARQNKR